MATASIEYTGRHVKAERVLCNVKQKELAAALKMDQSFLSMIENDKATLAQSEYARFIEVVRQLKAS